MSTRLRQVVLVARARAPVAERLEAELGLRDGYEDPNVIGFGLENVVYAVGDTFIEVIAPVREDTAAGRTLERQGEGGYMAIFQTADMDAARRRVADLGVRIVWKAELDDIAAMHLHPKDVPGAIVSIDRPDPPRSWRWAGPSWIGADVPDAPGGVRSVTLRVTDPAGVAERWAAVLGETALPDGDGASIALDEQHVAFLAAEPGSRARAREGITEIVVASPHGDPRTVTIGGVAFTVVAI